MLLMRLFVYFARVNFCPFFSSSWCRGFAAACDCGTPWTFLFYELQLQVGLQETFFKSLHSIKLPIGHLQCSGKRSIIRAFSDEYKVFSSATM